jgi:hypothetical protein
MANKKRSTRGTTKTRSTRSTRTESANRNARVETYTTGTGSLRTITDGRDDGSLKASVITQPRTDRTTVFIGRGDQSFLLNGREARTLYRVLSNHYAAAGKSVA